MYYREVKGCDGPSSMLLLTKSDAIWAAQKLDAEYGKLFFHEAQRRFLGYEGADYGVYRYARAESGHRGKYLHCIDHFHLVEMCKNQLIVPQSESFK